MKKLSSLLLSVAVASAVLLASCQNEKKSALEMNNKFAKHNLGLNQMGHKWSDGLVLARTTKDFGPVRQTSDSIVKVIDGMIADVDGMKDVGGSEALRKKELEYLHFERDFIQNSMKPFGSMNSSTTDEEFDSALRGMLESSQLENQHLAELSRLQEEFAKRNGFKLEPTPGAGA